MSRLSAFLYGIGLALYHLSIRLASPFNAKARAWVRGRRGVLSKLRAEATSLEGCVWFHCASLGEFEQGRPIIERLKSERPDIPILVTFFSPSGFEVRKDYPVADLVTYLPAATGRNARRFLHIVKPRVAVFIKYEYWLPYLRQMARQRVPLVVASSVFQKAHWLFKWYGRAIENELKHAHRIFVQNHESWKSISDRGFSNVSLASDTRFDRVSATVQANESDELVRRFAEGHFTLVAGSTWREEERLLRDLLEEDLPLRMVIAPHVVTRENVQRLRRWFPSALLYSEGDVRPGERVLIVDNVGLLSKLYRYGSLALVGGGFSGKLHNILEPAAFALPVVFGPKFHGYPEAVEMIGLGAGYPVNGITDLKRVIHRFISEPDSLSSAGREAQSFIEGNTGGTESIVGEIMGCIGSSAGHKSALDQVDEFGH